MASALVMSPSRHGERRGEPPLATPIMRLESIFERTRDASPPSGAAAPPRSRTDSGLSTLRAPDSCVGDRWRAGTRGASPQPHDIGGAASSDGAWESACDAASEQPQSPSPGPRAGSDSGSSGGSYDDGSQSPGAASEVGPLPQEGHLAASARRSPFRGCASMSLDQVRPSWQAPRMRPLTCSSLLDLYTGRLHRRTCRASTRCSQQVPALGDPSVCMHQPGVCVPSCIHHMKPA